MSLVLSGANPIHFPKGENFQFDEEVAQIFPDMAKRSIPMYEEVHRLHVSLLYDKILKPQSVIYDVGSSRGHFFKEICNQFHFLDETIEQPTTKDYSWYAVDTSGAMLKLLKRSMPTVTTIEADVLKLGVMPEQADVVVMLYLLQFIQGQNNKLAALRWAYEQLKPGGVLVLGQKELVHPESTGRFTEEYYGFRRRNGYTQEEIDRKTEALKGSMWPQPKCDLQGLCIEAGFPHYQETSRWLQFSTAICTKR